MKSCKQKKSRRSESISACVASICCQVGRYFADYAIMNEMEDGDFADLNSKKERVYYAYFLITFKRIFLKGAAISLRKEDVKEHFGVAYHSVQVFLLAVILHLLGCSRGLSYGSK